MPSSRNHESDIVKITNDLPHVHVTHEPCDTIFESHELDSFVRLSKCIAQALESGAMLMFDFAEIHLIPSVHMGNLVT